MNTIRLPFAVSLLGHAALLALVVLFVGRAPPLPLPEPTAGITVTFAPNLPQPEVPPALAPPPVPPPPPKPPPVAAIRPPPLPPPPEAPIPEAPTAEVPPLPPEKPAVRPLRRVERRIPPRVAVPVSPPTPPIAAPQPAPQPQAVAARVSTPAAAISRDYQALLGAWLERHKRYPEAARERGEEGRAVLQFAVDRNGRVIDFAVVKSSGYPDLDAAIDGMMQGATLPPFPDDMPQSSIKVSVAIRFSLEQ